jgi:uncharacterized protein (DUF1501 family)
MSRTDDRVLIVVFMRGGWDGLNIVVPYGESKYYSLRPTIAIPAPGSGKEGSALDLDGFFGLHPALASLHRLYEAGFVALLPTVHYSNSSRSHFQSQDIIESASQSLHDSGWLGRYLNMAYSDSVSSAISLSDQVPLSLSGTTTPVSSFPDISSVFLANSTADRSMLSRIIARSYQWDPIYDNANYRALRSIGGGLLNEISELQSVGQMAPDNGATYPNSTFGRQLRQSAALVKGRAGLDVIALDFGGWDTHSAQGAGEPAGRMSQLLRNFADSLSAFFQDLGDLSSRVMLLAVTEFGRTAAENGSKGTDHGNASTWMAIGPSIRGGIHLGSGWPGLESSRLVDQRALAHTVDFRAVYQAVLSKFLGVTNTSSILPGYSGDSIEIFS